WGGHGRRLVVRDVRTGSAIDGVAGQDASKSEGEKERREEDGHDEQKPPQRLAEDTHDRWSTSSSGFLAAGLTSRLEHVRVPVELVVVVPVALDVLARDDVPVRPVQVSVRGVVDDELLRRAGSGEAP